MPRVGSTTRQKSLYSDHPGVAMEAKAIAVLKEKTGRTLAEWIRLIRKTGPASPKERAAWLKREHGLGTNYAAWMAARVDMKEDARKPMDYDPEALVEAMFTGPKAGLRPIYARLLRVALKLGKDVTVTPCATIVPLRRRYVFAQIKPTTQTRIDLGLALKDTKPTGRLIDTGGRAKGDRITHRIPITTLAEINEEVQRWLKTAYDLDA